MHSQDEQEGGCLRSSSRTRRSVNSVQQNFSQVAMMRIQGTRRRDHSITRCHASTSGEESARQTRVKICGVMTPADASMAAAAGADFIGMILWPKAKRSVDPATTGRSIADAARQHGAVPVGVFVDEDADGIVKACRDAGVNVAQVRREVEGKGFAGCADHARLIRDWTPLGASMRGISMTTCHTNCRVQIIMSGPEVFPIPLLRLPSIPYLQYGHFTI